MSRDPAKTVYIGNLDERVSERVLYEILIQVGRVVDLYIPRDKETNRHKGYAFAEYESEEIADYAVRLFSGLVRLHNKTLKFAISGQDKSSHTTSTQIIPKPKFAPLPKPTSVRGSEIDVSREASRSIINCRVSGGHSLSPIDPHSSSNGLANHDIRSENYEYSRRVFGVMLNSVSRQGGTHPIAYPSY
ncbi:RNA-binding protein 7 [Canna indica]|uniref:RNA-binding protein 7 n=1 Tax=Canna indica TaxID=4628 RepID=A0AAQ3Q5A5_9LILI|nr:RNA-binding protein 7 [Canna indica]